MAGVAESLIDLRDDAQEETQSPSQPQSLLHRITDAVLRGPAVEMLAFRWLVVGSQATTILLTWPLWQEHANPPMLPALDLPVIDLGALLLFSLLLVILAPAVGISIHSGLLLYAILIDQTRLQPEFVSLLILMWGTLPHASLRSLARAHLVSLWFFAGFHKVISPGFIDGTAQWILAAYPVEPGTWLRSNFGYLVAATEMSLGILALIPRTRWIVGWMALGAHISILFVLLPTGNNWNSAVWPWNVALALSGFVFFSPWKTSLASLFTQCKPVLWAALLWLLLAPAGFYIGVTDAYLAHHLYSSSTASAQSSSFSSSTSWGAFNVPLPPEHRLFRQYFELTCEEGDTLVISDGRWWYRQKGLGTQRFTCPPNEGGAQEISGLRVD